MTAPRDLPAPGRRQTLCVALRLEQSPVFLINSRLDLFAVAGPRSGGKPLHATPAPLLPKLRGSFAEFLYHGSPDRLGMFYPPTCVGLRYGRARACLGVFLGTSGSLASLKCFVRSLALLRTGFPWSAGRAPSRGRPEPRRATPIRRPVGRSAACAVQECLPAARRLRLPASP